MATSLLMFIAKMTRFNNSLSKLRKSNDFKHVKNYCRFSRYTTIKIHAFIKFYNPLTNEELLVRQLGLKYTYIPVDFKNPTDEDFEKFVTSIRESESEKTWIHCAANMRVSAFIYKYRLEVLNHDATQAAADLAKIWEPFGVWKQFIKKSNE